MNEILRVIAFPGAPNLPVFAADEKGYFADEGLKLDLELTPSSVYQAEQTAGGACDIVCTAFDNAVAYSEGQGAVDVDPQYVVVMGATQLDVSFVAQPGIKEASDLRGKVVALDALTTGFAFVFYEILSRAGVSRDEVSLEPVGATPQRWQSVKEGKHAGTLTIEPFTSLAKNAGFNILGSTRTLFDSYQGGVIATTRPFLERHPDRVRGFLRAYLRGLDWTLDSVNRAAAAELLSARMPQIKPQAIGRVMDSLMDPRSGLTPNGAILSDGMITVLDLRSRYGGGDATLTDIERYLDLSHQAKALRDS